jgi:hypothetical protein
MRVPYFLLELGDTCIFQPQNQFDMSSGNSITIGTMSRKVVTAASYPDSDNVNLFLNGIEIKQDYKILKIKSSNMLIFEKIIDNYNGSQDV